VATIGTAICPQDAEGDTDHNARANSQGPVFGVLIPASILSTLFLGLWSTHASALPGFNLYSYVTVAVIVVIAGVGRLAVKTRYAGLSERVAALVTHQWLFVLALRLLLG